MTNKKSNTNATEILKKSDLVLLDNVQFIYELSLAELELSSLGIQYKTTNGLREFEILNKSIDTIELVKTKSSYFKTVDKFYTDYYHIIEKNTTSSINQYLTHWIYPYKGKFHPQMIRALINIIGLKEGDTLFEPFSGSGTTALEAQLLGVNLIGIDVSPLCVIQGKVKTQSIFAFDEILSLKGKVTDSISTNLFSIEKNYYEMLDDLTENETAKDFYKLARLVAVSDNSRRNRNFSTSFVKNLDLMIKSVKFYLEIKDKLELNLGNISINIGDARNVDLPDNSVDGIITSPPYSIALDYVQNDEHSLSDLGFNVSELRENFIGVRGNGKNKLNLYNEDMEKTYNEIYRVLKPGKFAVIVIGNATYQGNEVKTVEFTIEYMKKLGFSLENNIDKIIFGLYNVMKKEHILIFKKDGSL
ncbi:MAG TPA: DNA methyltransferase [Candidatus Kapabacteria bacterium]|nr:DNA methyltransferase [Candidatus Kapabacteria bacterium]HPP39056.1 DNA methyltransferase [Candidatus Kapabacteria bacterium]